MRDFVSFKSKEITGRIPLKAGDVILECEKPFVYIIDKECRGRQCEFCLEEARNHILFPCKKCFFHFYCSEGCQQQSWDEFHKFECDSLRRDFEKNRDFTVPNFARLLARIIFKLKDGGEKFEEKYSSNRGRKFKDLMNHYKDIKTDQNRMKDVTSLMKILQDYMGAENVPNESDFIGIYGRVLVNRFCLNDELNVAIGSAVFLAASIFDHSCIPNAYPSFVGKKLYIRTLVDVPQLNLDKVRISYVDCINGTDVRRQEIFKHWYFWCDCDLCNSEERKHYEQIMKCENPMCEESISVPSRYSQIEPMEELKKKTEEDSSVALKNALKAAKVQYNFANVPVNPFASSDAMMAYLFYDKNRYQLASDSDLTECTDDSPANTPPRQRSPEREASSTPMTNGVNGVHLTNGVHENETKPSKEKRKSLSLKEQALVEESGPGTSITATEGGKDKQSTDGSIKKKKLLKSKTSKKPTVNGNANHDSEAKKKSNVEKKSDSKDDRENAQSNDPLTNGAPNLTNGVNGTHQEEQQQTNGYTAEDEVEQEKVTEEEKKKKKLVKRHVFEKSDVVCKGCNCNVDRNTLREYRSAISFTIHRLKDMKEDSPNFQVVLDVLDRQGSLLPKLNVWRVRTLDFAFNAAFVNGAWVLAMKYGMENFDGMKFLYGDSHPTLGLFYMKLGKIHMTLAMYRKGLEYVDKAKDILTVAMGPKHPFVARELFALEQMAEEDPEIAIENKIARTEKKLKEICPCCGKPKSVHQKVKKEVERPWERDRMLIRELKQDSEYFNTNDYIY